MRTLMWCSTLVRDCCFGDASKARSAGMQAMPLWCWGQGGGPGRAAGTADLAASLTLTQQSHYKLQPPHRQGQG